MDYIVRFLFALLKITLIAAIVLTLCVCGFKLAMNVSNIYILVSDGMAMRTAVVLGISQQDELPKFFSNACIQSDPVYLEQTYVDYEMTAFDSEVEISSLDTTPMATTAKVALKQKVNSVTGFLPVSKQTTEQLANPNKIPAPQWTGNRNFELELTYMDDQWRITNVIPLPNTEEDDAAIAAIIEAAATPTPAPTATPAPSPTPVESAA